MKLKLPANAIAKQCENGLGRSCIKIPNKLGWDILLDVAHENDTSVNVLVKNIDVGIYSDHIIVDDSVLSEHA